MIRLGRYDEALEECLRLVHLTPDQRAAHFFLGQTSRRLGLYEEALSSFARSLELSDQKGLRAWTYYHRGTVQWILGRPEEADADYAAARDLLR